MPETDIAEPQTRQLPVQRRELMIAPGSWNPETRTVDVTWTTGARRTMFDWNRWDYVDEELSLDDGAIRFDRINNGGPVLNSHSSYDLEDQIGVVVAGTARIEGGIGVATLQMSRRESIAGLVQDIADGIIRNISVGYMVHQYEVTEKPGERPLMRAVDWEPAEISFVPIPADAAATVRGADTAPQGGHPCIIRRAIPPANLEAPHMADTTTAAAPAPANEETRAAPAAAVAAPAPAVRGVTTARLLERLDQAGLTAAARAEIVAIHDTAPLDERNLNAEIGARFADRDTAPAQRGTIQVTLDVADKVDRSIEATYLARMNPTAFAPAAGVTTFRGLSMVEIGREWLESRGVPGARLLDKREVANMLLSHRNVAPGHTTSDFAGLLGNVANKALRAPLVPAPITYTPFVRSRTIRDFKPFGSYQLTNGSKLDKVLESGEIKSGTIGSSGETYSLETFARIFTLSRQAIINDDLGAFEDLPMMFDSLKSTHNADRVYAVLTASQLMNDGVELFHATHGNLGTAAAISITSLGIARAAMAKQQDGAGVPLNVRPEILIVGPDKLTEAEQFVSTINAQVAGNVNPFAGRLQLATDARITGNQWFLAAAPNVANVGTIELAHLEGEEFGIIETEAGFRVDGISFKVRIDSGVKAIDRSGLYKNPGA